MFEAGFVQSPVVKNAGAVVQNDADFSAVFISSGEVKIAVSVEIMSDDCDGRLTFLSQSSPCCEKSVPARNVAEESDTRRIHHDERVIEASIIVKIAYGDVGGFGALPIREVSGHVEVRGGHRPRIGGKSDGRTEDAQRFGVIAVVKNAQVSRLGIGAEDNIVAAVVVGIANGSELAGFGDIRESIKSTGRIAEED